MIYNAIKKEHEVNLKVSCRHYKYSCFFHNSSSGQARIRLIQGHWRARKLFLNTNFKLEMFNFAQYVVDGVIGKVKIPKSTLIYTRNSFS